jgi:hypothetical protein
MRNKRLCSKTSLFCCCSCSLFNCEASLFICAVEASGVMTGRILTGAVAGVAGTLLVATTEKNIINFSKVRNIENTQNLRLKQQREQQRAFSVELQFSAQLANTPTFIKVHHFETRFMHSNSE